MMMMTREKKKERVFFPAVFLGILRESYNWQLLAAAFVLLGLFNPQSSCARLIRSHQSN